MYEKDPMSPGENGDERMDALEEKMDRLLGFLQPPGTEDAGGAGSPVQVLHDLQEAPIRRFETVGPTPPDVAGTEYEAWWKAGFTRMEIEMVGRDTWKLRVSVDRADTASVANEFPASVPLSRILGNLFTALSRQDLKEPMQKFDPNSQPQNMMRVMSKEEDRYFGRPR